jgi:hypothetical protein
MPDSILGQLSDLLARASAIGLRESPTALTGQCALCLLLIGSILALGIAPARVLDTLSTAVATMNPPAATSTLAISAR